MADSNNPISDEQLAELFRQLRSGGDTRLRDRIVADHRWLAERCARRFSGRGEQLDDLIQVAMIGLFKAVERFDPELGIPFNGYATPTVMGELRRHFRDATWAVKVPRRAKDLHVRIPSTVERLSQQLGKAPTVAQLAAELDVPEEQVIEGLDAGAAYSTDSLDRTFGDDDHTRAERLVGTDLDLALSERRTELRELLASLPERERRIVYLRFYEDRSQSEIAAEVGTSQVHVSRLLRSSLRKLAQRAQELSEEP